jgi:hypothetical protein
MTQSLHAPTTLPPDGKAKQQHGHVSEKPLQSTAKGSTPMQGQSLGGKASQASVNSSVAKVQAAVNAAVSAKMQMQQGVKGGPAKHFEESLGTVNKKEKEDDNRKKVVHLLLLSLSLFIYENYYYFYWCCILVLFIVAGFSFAGYLECG